MMSETASKKRRTLTKADYEELAEGVVLVVKPLLERIRTLEAEVKELKARPMQKWAGVHITGQQYSEASLVTKAGSLWVATTTTTTTPGEGANDWRLIVKRGHAG